MLELESNTRGIRESRVAVLDRDGVGESAKWLENPWIGLISPETQSRGDVERHLVSAVRHDLAPRPAVPLEYV